MNYLLHVFVFIEIFAVLAISLDLLAGHTGILSIAHGAFFGIGAYASAIVAIQFADSFFVGVSTGMTVAGIASLAIALPANRLHGDYLIVATLAFQLILSGIFNSWIELTGGPLGISGIPHPVVFGWHVKSNMDFAGLGAGFAIAAFLVVWLTTNSPFGRILHAIREDESIAHAFGKNAAHFKTFVFVMSSMLAAAAGSLYAHYVTYVDASSFAIAESILVISMIIVGGMGRLWGPLLGAAVMVLLPEALRFLGLPPAPAANIRQIIYGTLLVIMMMFRPRGLIGRYAFGR